MVMDANSFCSISIIALISLLGLPSIFSHLILSYLILSYPQGWLDWLYYWNVFCPNGNVRESNWSCIWRNQQNRNPFQRKELSLSISRLWANIPSLYFQTAISFWWEMFSNLMPIWMLQSVEWPAPQEPALFGSAVGKHSNSLPYNGSRCRSHYQYYLSI